MKKKIVFTLLILLILISFLVPVVKGIFVEKPNGNYVSFPDFRHADYFFIYEMNKFYYAVSYSSSEVFSFDESHSTLKWNISDPGGSFYQISLSTTSSNNHSYTYDGYDKAVSGSAMGFRKKFNNAFF